MLAQIPPAKPTEGVVLSHAIAGWATGGATVAVLGLGGVGQSVVQGARVAGAARVIAIDPVCPEVVSVAFIFIVRIDSLEFNPDTSFDCPVFRT